MGRSDRAGVSLSYELSTLKILITGSGSFIGTSFERYMSSFEGYKVTTLDMLDPSWRAKPFAGFDVVFHVAGMAHADVSSVSEETKAAYYKVNTELALEVATKAKDDGVPQFIFMSSMIIYSGCSGTHITKDTEPKPLNFYGDSKLQADQKLRTLCSPDFRVVVLRPPMIYGKGCKGNYPELRKLAMKLPIFPKVKNRRSMLHSDNLCSFIKCIIDNNDSGVFFPQNGEYSNTSVIVKEIARCHGRNILIVPGFNWALRLMMHIPGKIGALATKAFGDLYYDMDMSTYSVDYRVCSLKESIERTEGR